MKKLLIWLTVLTVWGCSPIQTEKAAPAATDEKEAESVDRVMTCSKDNMSTVFRYNGDEVIALNEVFYKTLDELGIPKDMDAEEVQSILDQSMQEKYGSLQGVDVIPVLEKDRVQYTLSIDLTAADLDQMVEAGLLSAGELENQYISMETTRETFEADGYACTVQ